VTLIELETPPPAPARSLRPPIAAYRPAGLIAVLLMLLAAGGAVPGTPRMLRLVQVIPLAHTGSSAFTGNHVVTVGEGGRRREVTAWQIDPPRRLWSTMTEVSPDRSAANYTFIRIVIAGDAVVLQLPDRSTVLDLGTGRTRFTLPATVEILAPGVGLARKAVFRPDAEPDPDASAGPEYTSEDGTTYRRPRVVAAVDQRVGRDPYARGRDVDLLLGPGALARPGHRADARRAGQRRCLVGADGCRSGGHRER
jgi:hypothetical protein